MSRSAIRRVVIQRGKHMWSIEIWFGLDGHSYRSYASLEECITYLGEFERSGVL